jgi:hypothetical protein
VRRVDPLEDPGRLAEALHLTAPRHSFAVVLGAIVVSVIWQMAEPGTEVSRLIGVLLQAAVALLALRAAGAHVNLMKVAGAIVSVLVVAAAVSIFGPGDLGPIAPRLVSLILVVLTPLAVVAGVVRELREDKRVTVQTVCCGLCLYLLLGTIFAFLFGAIEDIGDQPFFTNVAEGTSNDFLYYSLATLTTTGYGDFSAATEVGRAMSVTEALIGQMYLVTVLAVIVSNVRRQRPLGG